MNFHHNIRDPDESWTRRASFVSEVSSLARSDQVEAIASRLEAITILGTRNYYPDAHWTLTTRVLDRTNM